MKRIIGLLTVLLVAMISLGSFLEKDSVFLNVFLKNFNTTVTIVSKQEATHNTIQKLQELAKKNNISFIKEEYVPKNSRYEAQKVKIHIYLDDIAWFKKSFKTISVVENKNGSNAFQDADSINLLTSKKVVLSPFENISKEKVTGDYHIKGLEKDIQQFVDEINQNKVVKTEAVFNKDFIVSSDLTQKQAVLYIIMLFILFISIVFCNFIYNGMLSKELSISVLLGYNKLSLSFKKTFNLLIMPLIIGAGLATGIINYLVKPNNFFGFLVSMKSIFLLMIFTAVVIFLIEFVLLYLKLKGIDIIVVLKGYRRSYHKSSVLIKTGSMVVVFYLAVVSVLGLVDYMNVRQHISTWDKSKNYVNMACTWSWAYEKDDEKFRQVVVPKLNALWDRLDNEGAILFNAPNARMEGMSIDEKYLKKLAFQGDYAYVNENYLRFVNLVDKSGKNLERYKADDNEWIVFVPENIKINNYDRKKIHEDHLFQNKIKEGNIRERYVRIEEGKGVFSFDSSKRIDEANLQNYILIAVNGKELLPDHGVKLASLVNGQLHPFVKDSSKAYESLKSVVKETKSESFILYINSVYEEVVARINEYRKEAAVYIVGLILSILILATLLKIDREAYFYNHGQRIDVSRLLGYEFLEIHRNKIIENIIEYIISIALVFVVLIVASKIGLFIPRDGWTASKLLTSFIVAICGVSLCFSVEIFKIKKSEKNIVLRLKEGC